MSFDPLRDPRFPFVDFASNEEAYVGSRLFWQVAFEDAVPNAWRAWHDWMPDPFKDGHPIFSKLDPERRRGVLLQQVPESEDPVWFKCWLSDAPDPWSDKRVPYLFIETFVSTRARHLFEELVQQWCGTDVGEDRMRDVADRVRRHAAQSNDPLPVRADREQ